MKTTAINGLLLLLLLGFYNKAKAQEGIEFEYQPGKTTILADHPRLFFSKEEEAKILRRAKKDPLLNKMISTLYSQAKKELSSALLKGNSQDKIVSRIITLSLAYRLSGDKRYANRIEKELSNIASFDSWNPKLFLNTAEITTAVAVGYDWCYDQLSEKTKKEVENAIVNKAFAPAWPVYKHGGQGSWAKRSTNWNVVTNSGLVTGALAIADKYPKYARKIIGYAKKFVPNNIEHFAPEGVYYEGPAYWSYTTMRLSLLLDNFQRILGDDFGLSSMEGVSKTAQYYINTLSPSDRVFNFADASGTGATLEPIYFFFSQTFNQSEVADFYRSYIKKKLNNRSKQKVNLPRYFFLAIPWFDEASGGSLNKDKLQIYKGEPDIAVFNGNKSDPNELWLMTKGGKPATAHNQMDVGSFVVEDQGIRWGVDLGAENYDLPHFWDYKPNGVRWEYFRNNNLSHNTINIDEKIAYSRCHGKLSRFHRSNNRPFAILNISSCYKNQANSVMRGFKMLSSNVMLVNDHLKLKEKSRKVNWRFFTKADVNINDNIVELEQKDEKFYLKTFSQEGVKVHVNKSVKPNSPKAKPIQEVTMIEVSANAKKDNEVNISILMSKNIWELKDISLGDISTINEW